MYYTKKEKNIDELTSANLKISGFQKECFLCNENKRQFTDWEKILANCI